MLLLSNEDVRAVLTMQETIAALEQAYAELAAGEAICRPRIDMRIPVRERPDRFYQWGTMEGGSASGYFAIRMKSDVMYEEERYGARTEEKYCQRPGLFCGLILLTSVHNAEPLALIQDGYLQHYRVGADSGIGVKHLARHDAAVVGMIGSGGMARSHLDAFLQVRPIQRVQVYSPTPEHRAAYAHEMQERFGIEAVAVDSLAAACRGADIVSLCTDGARRFALASLLDPGVHVTAIGGRPDAATYASFDVYLRLGTCPATLNNDEALPDEVVAYAAMRQSDLWRSWQATGGRQLFQQELRSARTISLQDLLEGRAPGRENGEQRTYSERGNIQGAQFFAVAARVYEAAKRRGLGREIPTEWLLQDVRD